MPRPCALAILAAPYLAGLWRLLQARPGLALEGTLSLVEFALDLALGREPQPVQNQEPCYYPWECCESTPCPAPVRCEEPQVEPCVCEICPTCPAPVELEVIDCPLCSSEKCETCTPCPAPERCEETVKVDCEPELDQLVASEPDVTSVGLAQLSLGAVVSFVTGALSVCGCRPTPWSYGGRRAHYAVARAHVRGLLRG